MYNLADVRFSLKTIWQWAIRREVIMSTVSIADASRQLSQLINRAAYGQEAIVLTSRGQPKAVLLGFEEFQRLIGPGEYAERPLMPKEEFQQKFREAMVEAGYDTREKIIELVREVRREMAVEAGRLPKSTSA